MSFTNFHDESKKFCGYDAKSFADKLRWWAYYPIAAAKFYSYPIRDWWRFKRAQWKQEAP